MTPIGPHTKFIRTSFLQEHPDIRFPEGIRFGEDRVFHWKLCCWVGKYGYINKVLYYLRPNPYSLTARKKRPFEQSFPSCDLIDAFLSKNHFQSEYGDLHDFICHRVNMSNYYFLSTTHEYREARKKIKQLLQKTQFALFHGKYRKYQNQGWLVEQATVSFYKGINGNIIHAGLALFLRYMIHIGQNVRQTYHTLKQGVVCHLFH